MVNFDTWLKSGLLQLGQIGGLSENLIQKRKSFPQKSDWSYVLTIAATSETSGRGGDISDQKHWMTDQSRHLRSKQTDRSFHIFQKKS